MAFVMLVNESPDLVAGLWIETRIELYKDGANAAVEALDEEAADLQRQISLHTKITFAITKFIFNVHWESKNGERAKPKPQRLHKGTSRLRRSGVSHARSAPL